MILLSKNSIAVYDKQAMCGIDTKNTPQCLQLLVVCTHARVENLCLEKQSLKNNCFKNI